MDVGWIESMVVSCYDSNYTNNNKATEVIIQNCTILAPWRRSEDFVRWNSVKCAEAV